MATVTETDLIKSYVNDYFSRLDERIKSFLDEAETTPGKPDAKAKP